MRLAVIVIGLIVSLLGGFAARAGDEGATAWSATIAPADEPGERLVITGRVVDESGLPVAGARVYAYHTDIRGYYDEHGRDSSNPRLKATVHTDDAGRYRFDTIKPGPYPRGGIAAHIHVEVTGDGIESRRFDFLFDGDPYLSDGQRAQADRPLGRAIILEPEAKDGGPLRSDQDVVVRRN